MNPSRSGTMPAIVKSMNIGMVMLCFSCVAQLLGWAVPGWLCVEFRSKNQFSIFDLFEDVSGTDVSLNYALWYIIRCRHSTCLVKSYVQLNSEFENTVDMEDQVKSEYEFAANELSFPFSRLIEFQIEATVALVLMVLAFHTSRKQKNRYIHFFSGKRAERPTPKRHCLIFCLSLSSGILILIPITKMIDLNLQLDSMNRHTLKVGPPYGLILSALGGIVAIIACIFMLCTLCCTQCDEGGELYQGEPANPDALDDPNNQVRIQLVPLTPTAPGYADPVMPGYRPAIHDGQNINQAPTFITADFTHERVPGEQTPFVAPGANMPGSMESPPPSYDEVMRSGFHPS